MTDFYDLCLRHTSEEIKELAKELGWTATSCSYDTVFLEAGDWGELKRKIQESREEADVLVFKGGDEELNRKAAGDTRVDVLLHPESGRKDSGLNHVIAEEAAENRVAIGFDLQQLKGEDKERSHVVRHWKRNLKLCEKFGTPFLITTGAREKHDLRAPRDLASVITSLGYSGEKAVSQFPGSIVERADEASSGIETPGIEMKGEEG